MTTQSAPRVILGVGGGIAAYKVCELLRLFVESGYDVRVVPTADALRFVGEATWAALSRQPVATGVWDQAHEVPHVRLGQEADLVFVAPATADLLARAAHGLADDLLTNTLLTARCPVMFAPAMHTEMWEHPATQENVARLRRYGAVVLEPDEGRLTGADTGKGRLPEPGALFQAARSALRRATPTADLAGRHVVVSAGGTREALDPVRFLGNNSSGRQGYALAATAAARGARVTLVAANTALPTPAGVELRRVGSTQELNDAMFDVVAGDSVDAVVMAAAVADFRAATAAETKIKKSDGPPSIDLEPNPDILAALTRARVERRSRVRVIVGFAAETDDVRRNGERKLQDKGCDLLVVNEVGGGRAFGTADNQAVVLGADGSAVEIPFGPKEDLADRVWDMVLAWPGAAAGD